MTRRTNADGVDKAAISPTTPAFLDWPGDAAAQIAAADWRAVGFGDPDTWPQSLKAVVGMMVRTSVPMVVLWGTDGVMIYNDGYMPLTQGLNKQAMPVAEAWPEIADWNLSMLRKVLAGGHETFANMPLTLHRHGREDRLIFNLDYSPVLDDDGEIGGMMVIVAETTAAVAAEEARRAEEIRQRKMLDQMPGFAAVLTGPEHTFAYVNDAYLEIGGVRDYVGRTVRDVFPELEEQGFYELLDTVYGEGERYVARGLPINLSQNVRQSYIDILYEPIRDDDGQVIGIFVGGYNATETYENAERLAEREGFLSGVLKASTDCIKVLDLDGRLTFMSDGGREVMEVDDFSAIAGCPWPSLWEGEGSVQAAAAIDAARRGLSYNFIAPAATMKGTMKWWDVSVSPILGPDGKPDRILSVSRDRSDLLEAQKRQELLNAELGHRLKNVLTMVQSIATQTFGRAQDVDQAITSFNARLIAFGGATDVLTAKSWDSAPLRDVIDAGLLAIDAERERITANGPDLMLPAQAGLALTLALHELATNAVKYGALSNAEGQVRINWSTDADRFRLEWKELGGPPVVAPSRRGFGSQLIERSLRSYFGGEAVLHFDPDGVRFSIDAPLGQVELRRD